MSTEAVNLNQSAQRYGLSRSADTPFKLFWRQFRRNRLAVAAALVMILFYAAAVFAPYLAPCDPNQQILSERLKPPGFVSREDGRVYLLGTDNLGRDILSRIIYGSRISLSIGFVAMGIGLTIGIMAGAVAGYYGGAIDNILMRFTDMIFSFPTLMLIITVAALLKPSIFNIMAVIGVTGWPRIARLVRGEFLSLKTRDFVEAARTLGASDARIIFRHILPNAMAPIIVAATLGVAGSILVEAALSFLGLGVQPPTASWGNMLFEAQDYFRFNWWTALFPGLAIFFTVLSINLVGDGLRDALDPRLKP